MESPPTTEADLELEQSLGLDEVTTTTEGTRAVESLGLGDEELACVRAALPVGTDEAAVPVDVLVDVAGACVRGPTFGGAFAERLATEHPGRYSSEQLACLGLAYGQLPNDEVRALVRAGFEPQSADSAEADRVLNGLFAGCSAERP